MMPIDDQIHIIEGDVFEGCLSDLEQFNMLDLVMIEKPPSKKAYNEGFYHEAFKHIGNLAVRYDRGDTPHGRVQALQYCFTKPSMRKVLIHWRPRTVEYISVFDTTLKFRPFNFAYLSTYMRLKPKFRWTKKQYISQLNQVKELWMYEDDISPESFLQEESKVVLGMLEPDNSEEQMESIREVFGGWNILFILYKDPSYDKAIRMEGAKLKAKSVSASEEAYLKNGWTTTQRAGFRTSTLAKIKSQGVRKRKTREEIRIAEEARQKFREENPLRYLNQLIIGRKSVISKNLNTNTNTEGVDAKIKKCLEKCFDKGVDREVIEGLNWGISYLAFMEIIEEVWSGR
jgi:hypothetical protein